MTDWVPEIWVPDFRRALEKWVQLFLRTHFSGNFGYPKFGLRIIPDPSLQFMLDILAVFGIEFSSIALPLVENNLPVPDRVLPRLISFLSLFIYI